MATEVIVDFGDGPLTRLEIAEAITNLCLTAKREHPVVEQWTTDKPTPWTLRHRALNDLLSEWEASA